VTVVDGESERRPTRDAATLPPPTEKVAAGTKHSRQGNDGDTLSPTKKRKTGLQVRENSDSMEQSEVSLQPSGQSPSSSTPDTQVPPTHNTDSTTTQDSGSGVCAADSSCDDINTTTTDIKRTDCVVKDADRSTALQDDLTVQQTGSLLPVATQ